MVARIRHTTVIKSHVNLYSISPRFPACLAATSFNDWLPVSDTPLEREAGQTTFHGNQSSEKVWKHHRQRTNITERKLCSKDWSYTSKYEARSQKFDELRHGWSPPDKDSAILWCVWSAPPFFRWSGGDRFCQRWRDTGCCGRMLKEFHYIIFKHKYVLLYRLSACMWSMLKMLDMSFLY